MYGAKKKQPKQQLWPDGSVMSEWFSDTTKVDVETLGKKYVITEYGVGMDSTVVQTAKIQAVIDKAAQMGGGVVVVPKGTFLSGSLFFKQGTHLYIEEGGKLKGSERIADFEIKETRIEGQTCKYFTALVNAAGIDGFTMLVREPSMAMAIITGMSSGFAVSGIHSAPIRMHSAHDLHISQTVRT